MIASGGESFVQLSAKKCCDCPAMSLQRSVMSPSDFSSFLLKNCVAPSAECRIKDVLRCSHALTSKLFDNQGECRKVSSASMASMCHNDCRSVSSIQPTMTAAKSLVVGDVVASVFGMVRSAETKQPKAFLCGLSGDTVLRY